MVDRGRSPIRPTPSPLTSRDAVTDPVEAVDELDIETSSLAVNELAELLREDEKSRSPTVEITAPELDALLKKAGPVRVPAPPPSRPLLTTQPYDEVTAYVLLDKDAASPQAPPADENAAYDDAPAIETETIVSTEDEIDDEPIDVGDEPETAIETATEPAPIVPAARTSAPASQSIPPAGPVSASPPAIPSFSSAPLPSPARASLPSAGMEWPGENDRKRKTRMVIGAVGTLVAITILYLVIAESEPAPTPAIPVVLDVPTPPPAAPTASAPKPQSLAEIDARKALSRLRDGMGDCVRRAIGSLPGSSPAVPPTMKQTSGVGYTAVPADWRTAVWSCAKFRHDAPMQFQVQWQSVKPGAEALGLAWVDDDGDGDPDRAFGFRATAKGTRDVDLGDIGPVEMRPVLPVR